MTKRLFDIVLSIVLLFFLILSLGVIWIISSIHLKKNGFFFQKRIGQYGKEFTIIKIKTIHPVSNKISKWSSFLRKNKLDELPQLFNILIGEMSFVGPRPDVPGYYDTLEGEERQILLLKPGLTSEATIKYVKEEELLKKQKKPLHYNDTIIFPDKVKINLKYYYEQSFLLDLKILVRTIKKMK